MARDRTRKAAVQTIRELKASDPKKYWSVSEPGHGYRAHAVGDSGFVAMHANHERVDVGGPVAKPGAKGVARQAMNMADRLHPEHPQTLDAFDGHLPQIYGKLGFEETGRMPFDPKYAPKEWDPETHGRPDVVFMSRPAAQGSLFEHMPTTPPPVSKEHFNTAQFGGHMDQGGLW